MMDGDDNETIFNLKMTIQQLQDKINYLAGGTDAEQLSEVLMEREEECRSKERTIQALDVHVAELSSQLEEAQLEQQGLQNINIKHVETISGLHYRITSLTSNRDDVLATVQQYSENNHKLEADVEGLRSSCVRLQKNLDTTSAQLARRQAQLEGAQSIVQKQETAINELQLRKNEMASRSRAMKLELENSLNVEKASVASLQAQLQACKTELTETRGMLQQKVKALEETRSRETKVMQDKGQFKARLDRQAEEIQALQSELTRYTQENKLIQSQMMSKSRLAAKLEEDIAVLGREKERRDLQVLSEVTKLEQERRDLEKRYKQRMTEQAFKLEQVETELVRQKGVLAEELTQARHQHEDQARNFLQTIEVRTAEADRLADELKDVREQARQQQESLEQKLEEQSHWAKTLQHCQDDANYRLANERELSCRLARAQQENAAFQEKISRQEAYMRRRLKMDRTMDTSTTGCSLLEERRAEKKASSVGRQPCAASLASQYKAAAIYSAGKKSEHVPPRQLLRGDKENWQSQLNTFLQGKESGRPLNYSPPRRSADPALDTHSTCTNLSSFSSPSIRDRRALTPTSKADRSSLKSTPRKLSALASPGLNYARSPLPGHRGSSSSVRAVSPRSWR